MALYKYSNYLKPNKNGTFDQILPAGLHIPAGGIYRCVGCGNEIAQEGNSVLPDRGHHTHSAAQGEIRWQLILATETNVPAPYLHS